MNVVFKFRLNQNVRSVHHNSLLGVVQTCAIGQSKTNGYWVEYLDDAGRIQSHYFLEDEIEPTHEEDM